MLTNLMTSMIDTCHPSTYGFASTSEQRNLAPPRYVRSEEIHEAAFAPIPTNKWWGNLIHQDMNNPDGPIEPIWSNPYAIRVVPGKGLVVSGIHRHYGPCLEINPKVKALKYYAHAFIDDIILSAVDLPAGLDVYGWDDFGVRIQLGKRMNSSLVRGMAFVSATYGLGTRPRIETIHAISSINGEAPSPDAYYAVSPGSKLVLEFNNGQFWTVYADQDIRFSKEGSGLTATDAVDTATTVRIARVENPENRLDVLDEYAKCVVLGGRVQFLSHKRYNLEWETVGEGSFLHFALEHHLHSFLEPPTNVSILAESTTHGRMHGICSSRSRDNGRIRVWELAEPKSMPIRFEPQHGIDPAYVKEFRIDERLKEEIESSWVISREGSYYFNGKLMQKFASLCLMAHDDAINRDDKIKRICLEKLASLWDSFLSNGDGEWPHPLVFDEIYGGIVSSEGFKKNDQNVDFGNTVYNDHHYHYGYWLVSASIFLHLHPGYPRAKELRGKIDVLVRDVANPNASDHWFPRFRHFDWFLGHSYSHGVTPMADGKDQESISEEINFHYGLMLWGMATDRLDVEQLGELLLKINARTARTYFFMADDNVIHPKEFVPNKVTGIFFDNKADCTTWFSPERHCIHGIQMLPFSPVTPLFRPQKFVKEEWESILSNLPVVLDPKSNLNSWQSILFVNSARVVSNRANAMKHLEYVPMDNGLSRSWALYMAATLCDA